MSKWELTEDEKLKIFRDWRLEQGMNILIDNYLQAQVKKMVERLEAPCLMHLHGRDNPKETSKHCRLCSTCMRELRHQAELE